MKIVRKSEVSEAEYKYASCAYSGMESNLVRTKRKSSPVVDEVLSYDDDYIELERSDEELEDADERVDH